MGGFLRHGASRRLQSELAKGTPGPLTHEGLVHSAVVSVVDVSAQVASGRPRQE